MRKVLAAVLGVASVVAFAGPAQAAHDRSRSSVINVYWVSQSPIDPTHFTQTTWYVGVYSSSDGTWSDLYQDISNCTVHAHYDECTGQSFMVGYTDLTGPNDAFTMDTSGLTTAHLAGTYELQAYDSDGNPVGDPEPYTITSDVAGTGRLLKNKQTYSFHSHCFRQVTKVVGLSRDISATGTLNGSENLGTTTQGFMGTDSSVTTTITC